MGSECSPSRLDIKSTLVKLQNFADKSRAVDPNSHGSAFICRSRSGSRRANFENKTGKMEGK